MNDTTMNTGAASLSDERERAAITACALMIKGICLTRPNAEWTGAIEDRIQFMLKQMQAGAAIAAGGAQEAVAVVDENDDGLFVEILQGEDGTPLKRGDNLYAAPLPRVAETVPEGDSVYAALDRRAQSYISREAVEDVLIAVRAILAASNGEQA